MPFPGIWPVISGRARMTMPSLRTGAHREAAVDGLAPLIDVGILQEGAQIYIGDTLVIMDMETGGATVRVITVMTLPSNRVVSNTAARMGSSSCLASDGGCRAHVLHSISREVRNVGRRARVDGWHPSLALHKYGSFALMAPAERRESGLMEQRGPCQPAGTRG